MICKSWLLKGLTLKLNPEISEILFVCIFAIVQDSLRGDSKKEVAATIRASSAFYYPEPSKPFVATICQTNSLIRAHTQGRTLSDDVGRFDHSIGLCFTIMPGNLHKSQIWLSDPIQISIDAYILEVICNHESNADCLCLMWWPRSFWEVKTKQNESKQVPHISFCLYKGLDNYANGDQVRLPRFWRKRPTDDQLWLFWNPGKNIFDIISSCYIMQYTRTF